jgi:regulator of sigma E protease
VPAFLFRQAVGFLVFLGLVITFLIFLLVISVLVFVHELGHFVMAKRAGMKVEEFGFGFPPRIWGKKKGGTFYSINAIPFGGFVKIFGEEGEHRREPGSFGHGSFWAKVGVIVAGVAMNFLFAAILLVGNNYFGLRVGIFDEPTAQRATNLKLEILQVASGSPAEKAGLRSLDEIVGFVDAKGVRKETRTPELVQDFSFSHAGQKVAIIIQRGSSQVDIPMQLRQTSPTGEGPIGISLALTGEIHYAWYESIWRGFASAGMLFVATLAGYWGLLVSLFRSGHLAADVAGPIGIATLTGQAAGVGFNYLVQFVAMISVNLAVLNILPFPALDGGRLALILVEKVRRKPLSHKIEDTINSIGFMILIALMVAVTVKDIVKFF